MGRRRELGRLAAETGFDVVRGRVAVYAGVVVALAAGGLALLGCLIAALAGAGPGLDTGALIVIGTAIGAGLLARALVNRVTVGAIAALIARRVARRRRRRLP